MNRRPIPCAALLVLIGCLVGGLVGCDDERELPEDPDLVVPGHEVTPPPSPAMLAANATPTEFDPPLVVPGYDELPPPPMPEGMMQVPPQAPVVIAPGFQPQPAVRQGIAGGQVDASQMNQACNGFISTQPSFVIQLTAPFQHLRILVASEADTTLVVRGPDQNFRCVDDVEGLNPIIEGPFGPGAWTVWVGTYQAGTPAPYAIGFTEIPQITTAQLAAGGAPPGGAPPMQPNP